MLLYWLQKEKKVYSRYFGLHGFAIHGVQLGGTWIGIGLGLLVLFFHLPPHPFHASVLLPQFGILCFLLGIGMMLGSTWQLGWKRVMKLRLFISPEPPWVTTGLFRYFKDPMYLGSQLAMLGLAFAFNSWFLLVYVFQMLILQSILAKLENSQPKQEKTSIQLATCSENCDK